MRQRGIQAGDTYPYIADVSTNYNMCVISTELELNLLYNYQTNRMCEKNDSLAILGDYDEFEEGDENEMLRKLFKYGPLSAYLDITSEFQLYRGKDKVCGAA